MKYSMTASKKSSYLVKILSDFAIDQLSIARELKNIYIIEIQLFLS